MTPTERSESDTPTVAESDTPARRARLATTHADPPVVAGAIEPDNTEQMATTVTPERVVTTIERPGTGGLQSTVDDYLVNLQVADSVASDADTRNYADSESTHSQTNDAADTTTNDT